LKAADIGVDYVFAGYLLEERILEVLSPMVAPDTGHDRGYELSLRERVGDPHIELDWGGRQEAEDRAIRPDIFCCVFSQDGLPYC